MRDLGFEITDFKYIGYDTQTLFHPSSLSICRGCEREFLKRSHRAPWPLLSSARDFRPARPAAARPGFLSEGRSPVTLPGNLFNFQSRRFPSVQPCSAFARSSPRARSQST